MPTKMTLSASVALYRMLINLLYDENQVERDYPFNVKYKLQRSRDLLTQDALTFEQRRTALIKEFGEQTEEGTYQVTDENMQKFRSEADKLLAVEVEHTFKKLTPTEVAAIDIKGVSCDEMDLFIACMIDDPDFTAEVGQAKPDTEDDGEAGAVEEVAATETQEISAE